MTAGRGATKVSLSVERWAFSFFILAGMEDVFVNTITQAIVIGVRLGTRLRPFFLSFQAKSSDLSFFCS
jgi:hypothetical protein